MARFSIIAMIGFALLLTACTKSKNDNNEAALYGTWVNNNAPNDTLWFMNKGGKNILRYNNSFNTGAPMYSEAEYFFKNGELSFALGGPSGITRLIDSFTWKQENKEFDILIYQLYLFISSSSTHGSYTKIQ
jgi:hypothetical protein